MATDPWTWWRAALANPRSIGTELLVNEQDVQSGYYRAKGSDGVWLPVVLWYGKDDGVLRCLHGGVAVTHLNRITDLWLRSCRNPISTAQYKKWEADGSWADVDATVAEQLRGSNVADVDPEILLADQIASALAGLSAYGSVDSDEAAAAAQSLRARLLELKGQVEKAHKVEKAPWLEGGKAVDAKWLPHAKDADAGAAKLRAAISAWETVKLNQQRAAEAARRAAELEAAQEHALPEPELPEPEPVKAQVRGGYGKAAAVRSKIVVDQVTDWFKLFGWYRDREEVQQLLVKLANVDLARGRDDVPGVTIKEVADVR